MANESLSKFQDAVTRTTATIGVKTSVFVGSAKIKTQIGTLKNEISSLELELGRGVYESWEKGEVDTVLIQEQCEKIAGKFSNIEKLNQEIVKLELQEEEVLGVKKVDGGVVQSMDETKSQFICPNCSATFDTPIKFCRNCGTKMA